MVKIKKTIRSVNAAICFSIFGVGALGIGSFILPIIFLISFNEERRKHLFCNFIRLSWRFFVFTMEALRLIKVNISAKDKERLRKIESKIVVANHPSLIDIVILISMVNKPICIVKGKLTQNFFMKKIILFAYINNDISSEKLLEKSIETLDMGYNLIIFPEGTRTLPEVETKLQKGAAHIAIVSKAKILPIQIKMSKQILGKHQKWHDLDDETIVYDLKLKKEIDSSKIVESSRTNTVNARKITEMIKNSIEI